MRKRTIGFVTALLLGMGWTHYPQLDIGSGSPDSTSAGDVAAAVQIPFAVIGISPEPEATNVPVTTTVTATFNLPLLAKSVTTQTFQLKALSGVAAIPVAGTVSVLGPTATFIPLVPLMPQTVYQVRIVGGPRGVLSSNELFLSSDFVSTFQTGETTGGVTVGRNGGTVTDPRTGASASIAANTLKGDVRVRILTLDSPAQIGQVDNSCGVSIRPDELLPGVPGFLRVSEVVRYEVQPCGAKAFGPSMTLRFPLISPFRGTLPIGAELRIFQLGRTAQGELVFRDTGIPAKVIGGFLTGTAAVVPGIPVFGTFAGFLPISRSAKAGQTRSSALFVRAARRARGRSLVREATPEAFKMSEGAANEIRSLTFPLVVESGGRRTRIFLANPGSAPVDVTFVAYRPEGTEFGRISLRLDGGRQLSMRVADAFAGFTRGTIVAQSNGAITGFSEVVDAYDRPAVMAGAEGIRRNLSAMVFPVVMTLGNDATEIHVFNPSEEAVRISVKAFDASGTARPLIDESGSPISDFILPPLATYIASSRDMEANTGPAFIPWAEINGGYLLIQSLDPDRGLAGTEIFGSEASVQRTVAVLNGLPLPSGCKLTAGDATCRVDQSPQSEIPEAVRQYTLYGLHFDDPPASSQLILVNVSDQPARVAVSGFREDGSFRGSFPASGFLVPDLPPRSVLRVPLPAALGFHPAPGYVRIEDQDSAVVGVVINFDPATGRYKTVLPLVPDDPRQAQLNVTTFLSRLQLDASSSPEPRQSTGVIVFNPNNNSVPFTLTIRDNSGRVQTSSYVVAARGVFIRLRAAVSFPTTNNGYIQMQTNGTLLPGTGARLVMVGLYRARGSSGVQTSSPVLEQTRDGN